MPKFLFSVYQRRSNTVNLPSVISLTEKLLENYFLISEFLAVSEFSLLLIAPKLLNLVALFCSVVVHCGAAGGAADRRLPAVGASCLSRRRSIYIVAVTAVRSKRRGRVAGVPRGCTSTRITTAFVSVGL